MITIRYASEDDHNYLAANDHHVQAEIIAKKIKDSEIIVGADETQQIGWLRYGFFWDNIPFMNMLWIEKSYRDKGIGRKLVSFWHTEMHNKGYDMVMTSTLSDETAQHFYRKLGYKDCGSLLLPDEALEILFSKVV